MRRARCVLLPLVFAAGCAAADGRGPLDVYLEGEFTPGGPGGVVLVARGDRVILRRAFGLADLRTHEPMRVDHSMPIGSITKGFTALAVLQLVQEGEVALGDPLERHLPNLPALYRGITQEQVLTHTSGLPNLVDVDGWETWAETERTVEELIDYTADLPLHFEPGTAFRYSDTGYILLGALVEHIRGVTYADVIDEWIIRPLTLGDTYSATRLRGGEPRGYTWVDSSFVSPHRFHMSVAHASGALYSTADDLWRWLRALRDGAILEADLLSKAWSGRALPDGSTSGYGFGWKTCTLAGRRTVQHGGWITGFTATLMLLPDEDLAAVVLVNQDSGRPEAGYVARRALRLILTGSADLRELELAADQRSRLTGIYETDDGRRYHVAEAGNELVWHLDGERERMLVPLSATSLAVEGSDGTFTLEFILGGAGPATGVRETLSCEPRPLATRVTAR